MSKYSRPQEEGGYITFCLLGVAITSSQSTKLISACLP
jgi:hypothetical protein